MADVDGAAVVRRFWTEIWGEGRLDLLDQVVADPFVRHTGTGTVVRTREEFRSDLVQYRRVLSKLTVDFHDQTTSGDRVWTRLTATGFDQDTGESHRLSWLLLHRLEDGRLAESWGLYESGLDWDR